MRAYWLGQRRSCSQSAVPASPLFERYLYDPLVQLVERVAAAVRPLQSGDVNLYLLYVFLVVMIAYLIYPY